MVFFLSLRQLLLQFILLWLIFLKSVLYYSNNQVAVITDTKIKEVYYKKWGGL